VKIFRRVCRSFQIELPEHILEYLEKDFYPEVGMTCAAFHPIFIVEHAIAACRYLGMPPRLSLELVQDALASLYISE
jgi:hypothetical protein